MLRNMIRVSLVVACLFGCVPAIPETDFDSSLAREVLDTALTAWREGKAKTLSKRNPTIRFVDEDWRAGYRLAKFEVVHPDEPIQLHKGTQIQLTLIDPNGKTITRPAEYQITLTPNIAVLRSDP
jgi:hypothetical protein